MKVKSVSNDLADRLITPLHRQWFEMYFGAGLRWYSPEIDSIHTVHGMYIIRGYPYYWLRVSGGARYRSKPTWQMFPSVCFDVIDSRVSKYWVSDVRVIERQGDQFFRCMFGIDKWINEPGFWERVVDGDKDAHDTMTMASYMMDMEFE